MVYYGQQVALMFVRYVKLVCLTISVLRLNRVTYNLNLLDWIVTLHLALHRTCREKSVCKSYTLCYINELQTIMHKR